MNKKLGGGKEARTLGGPSSRRYKKNIKLWVGGPADRTRAPGGPFPSSLRYKKNIKLWVKL